jgi:fatty-acyl-CoA synthase
MKGQMMNYPLTTNVIIEYGNRVFSRKEIVSKLPDGSWHRYTYGDFYKRTKKLSNALINQLGVKQSDRVATFCWNHYEHLEMYYAIPGVGAVCHPLNVRLSIDQIVYIIKHAEDKVIFFDATLAPLLEKVAPQVSPDIKYVVVNAPADFKTSIPHVVDYETLIATESETFEWLMVDENDACGLSYTSGTTGDPKGALYSHRSTYLHALTIMSPNAANISSNDRILLVVPQFHVMAWGYPFVCMLAGADMVFPSMHLQPDALIEILQKEKITVANGVPTIWMGVYDAMKKNPPKEKLALREYIVGGSALAPSLTRGFEKDFGLKGTQAWGMTETSPLGTTSRIQKVHENLTYEEQLKIRSKQGYELPGVELRAIEENGTVAPRDGHAIGEFEIRGAWVIASYYNFPDNASRFSKDGWFKTGDVGTIDEYGYMNITDRSKDLIKSGGEWISSMALELALMGIPKIKEAAVIAIPDDKWVERPLACIVLKEGETITIEEIRTALSNEFASYQIPGSFVALKEVPKTSVGKFDKKEMRRLHAIDQLK